MVTALLSGIAAAERSRSCIRYYIFLSAHRQKNSETKENFINSWKPTKKETNDSIAIALRAATKHDTLTETLDDSNMSLSAAGIGTSKAPIKCHVLDTVKGVLGASIGRKSHYYARGWFLTLSPHLPTATGGLRGKQKEKTDQNSKVYSNNQSRGSHQARQCFGHSNSMRARTLAGTVSGRRLRCGSRLCRRMGGRNGVYPCFSKVNVEGFVWVQGLCKYSIHQCFLVISQHSHCKRRAKSRYNFASRRTPFLG